MNASHLSAPPGRTDCLHRYWHTLPDSAREEENWPSASCDERRHNARLGPRRASPLTATTRSGWPAAGKTAPSRRSLPSGTLSSTAHSTRAASTAPTATGTRESSVATGAPSTGQARPGTWLHPRRRARCRAIDAAYTAKYGNGSPTRAITSQKGRSDHPAHRPPLIKGNGASRWMRRCNSLSSPAAAVRTMSSRCWRWSPQCSSAPEAPPHRHVHHTRRKHQQ